MKAAPDPGQIRALKLFLIGTLVVGALGSALARPLPVQLPSWTIAPLWTLTYGLMAVSAWLIWKTAGLKSPALTLFAAQLALNLIWRVVPIPALAVVMNLCVLATLVLFVRRNLLAALTFLPCLAWSLFVSASVTGF
jgi:benzodiazapine receptor